MVNGAKTASLRAGKSALAPAAIADAATMAFAPTAITAPASSTSTSVRRDVRSRWAETGLEACVAVMEEPFCGQEFLVRRSYYLTDLKVVRRSNRCRAN